MNLRESNRVGFLVSWLGFSVLLFLLVVFGIRNAMAQQTTDGIGGLLAGNPDWGRPPKENTPTVIPELPALQGWYWLLGSGYPDLLEVNNDTVLTGKSGLLLGLDRTTGSPRWQTTRYSYVREPRTIYDAAVFSVGQATLVALNFADGGELWRKSGLEQVLVSSPGACWLTSWPSYNRVWDWSNPAFVLVDTRSGAELKRIATAGVQGASTGSLAGDPWLVLKRGSEFVAYSSQDDEVHIPADYVGSPAWIGVVDGGFVAAEFGKPYSEDAREKPVALTAVDLPSGKVRWQQKLSPANYYAFHLEGPEFNQAYLCHSDEDNKLRVLSMSDGSEVYRTAYPARQVDLASARLAYSEYEGKRIQLVDLERGTEVTALQAEIEPRQLRLAGDWLYFLNDNQTLGGKFDSVYAAWGVELREVAQQGQLTVLNAPSTPPELVTAFFASDPLADPQLMRAVVEGGSNQILDLLGRATPDTPAQLDALLAAAAYSTDLRLDTYITSSNALKSLIDSLAEQATPEYAPQIIRWLDDPSLVKIRPGLLGLLALAGGPQASAWLDAYYGQFLHQEFTPAMPPFTGCLAHEYTTRLDPFERHQTDETLKKRTYLDLVSARSGDKRYELFSSHMLGFERDLFIGVQNVGANGYSEILYTGLTDIFFITAPYRSYGTEIHRRGPVRLKVSGDRISVTHHEPVYTTKQWDSGGTYTDFSDTRYVTTRLSLAALRRDSDSDGLTDKLEARLWTSPTSPDTDGDGIADVRDRMPNVNPANWGPIERGIARALVFHYRESEITDKDECGKVPPLRARYFSVSSEIPVSIAIGAGYSIWTSKNPQTARSVSASWDAKADGWRHAWGKAAYGEEIKALAHMGSGNQGLMTTLTEINGEYYPVEETVTAIAD